MEISPMLQQPVESLLGRFRRFDVRAIKDLSGDARVVHTPCGSQ